MSRMTKLTRNAVAESVASKAIRKVERSGGAASLTAEEKMALAVPARDADGTVWIPILGTIS